MSAVTVRHASLTDVGVKRSHNQDAFTAQPAADAARFEHVGHLFVVADGMGGHAVGEKASAMAVRGIPLTFQKYVAKEGVVGALVRAFIETNSEIHDIGRNNPEFHGLGTTGTILVLRPEGAWIGHVGDSRVYRIRGSRIEQLTFDHSYVWEIARREGIDPDELGDFRKNVIIRSLGPDPDVLADIEGPHPVEPGDVFLLCSDGLSNMVPPDEIGAVATALPPDDAVKFLVELANVRGGPDNITAMMVQVPGEPTPGGKLAGPTTGAKLRAMIRRLDSRVPVSYMMLGFGSTLALAALALNTAWLFAAAAVIIVLGMVGLVLHFRALRHPQPQEPGELHIYRSYEFDHSPPLIERYAEVEATLSESLKEREQDVDWTAHRKWSDQTAEQLNKSNNLAAFRARCKAVQVLAAAFNRDRSKEESFSPNYTAHH